MKVLTATWARRIGTWRKETRAQLQVRTSEVTQRFADDVRRIVQRKILAGEVGGPALSQDWVEDKESRNMSEKKLIETGSMVENINVTAGLRNKSGKEGVVFGIGIPENSYSLRGAPSWLPLVHETGSGGAHPVPARPVWKRALIEAKASSPAYRKLMYGKWIEFKMSKVK